MCDVKNILAHVDHTLLSQTATWSEIRALCDDGMKYGTASVCIPASYVKQAAAYVAGKLLKVIIETCLLTDDEKIRMCGIVSESGADYIKTSTGFSKAGATREDVALFARHVASHLKIKAAGGISSLEDAQAFLDLGASRLGTSRIVKIVKSENLL